MNLIDKDALMWRKTGHGTPCLYEEDLAAAPVIISNTGNMTNGDIIKALYDINNDTVSIEMIDDVVNVIIETEGVKEKLIFTRYWWDTPYKGGV